MDNSKKLVISILKFLQGEADSGKHNNDTVESIGVAVQCLQQAYDLENLDQYPEEKSLMDIFCGARQTQSGETGATTSDTKKKSAEYFKEQGNSFMKNDNYEKAIECYSMAISLDNTNAIFYCNRAAAYTKLGKNTDAISDCEEAIKLNPLYSTAYGRLGFVYLSIGNHSKAVYYYEKALHLEPNNTNHRNNLEIAKEKLEPSSESSAGKPPQPGAAGMPNVGGLDFGSLLSNPAVMNMAQSFMANPQMQSMVANLMGGMMSGGEATSQNTSSTGSSASANTQSRPPPDEAQAQAQTPNLADVFSATQQFAEQMQRTNPDLVNQLRTQFNQGQPRGPDSNPPGN